MRAELCASPLKDDDAENLRKRVSLPNRDGERLFAFLDVNGMDPTNNHAEQALLLHRKNTPAENLYRIENIPPHDTS